MYTCISYRGHEIEVYGKFIPGSPAVITSDPERSRPAEEDSIEDYQFMLFGEDVTDLLEEVEDEILDLAIEQYKEERMSA